MSKISTCKYCDTQFRVKSGSTGKFCSQSCSAHYNNKIRSPISRQKQKQSLLLTLSIKPRNISKKKIRYTIVCKNCGESHQKPSKQKFCSPICWTDYTRKNKDAFKQYRQDCKFKFDVYDHPTLFDLNLLEEHGWYRPSNRGNNLSGVSRDHLYSVKDGFINNVDPYIISHPVNCRLILHIENQKKKDKSIITLDELIKRVIIFNIQCRGAGMVTEQTANL